MSWRTELFWAYGNFVGLISQIWVNFPIQGLRSETLSSDILILEQVSQHKNRNLFASQYFPSAGTSQKTVLIFNFDLFFRVNANYPIAAFSCLFVTRWCLTSLYIWWFSVCRTHWHWNSNTFWWTSSSTSMYWFFATWDLSFLDSNTTFSRTFTKLKWFPIICCWNWCYLMNQSRSSRFESVTMT